MTLRSHANRLVAAIPANVRQALALDAEGALTGLLGIHVASVPQLQDSRGAGGWCDGLSLTTNRSSATRRHPDHDGRTSPCCTNSAISASMMTTMHSTGSPTEQTLQAIWNAYATRSQPGFSSRRRRLPRSFPVTLPQPAHLRQLYTASRASEEVCAIALAAHLPARGAITLIQRRTATVAFAAGSGWPPLSIPRGLTVPPGHPLRDLGTRQRWSGWTTPDLRLAFNALPGGAVHPSGPISREGLLEAQAEAGPRRTTAILLDTTSRGEGRPQAAGDADHGAADVAKTELVCPNCGHTGAREHYPCPECGVPPCPACGRCPCL